MVNTLEYMVGRKKYNRPQAMLWANNPGIIVFDEDGPLDNGTVPNSYYIPEGYEIGSLNNNGDDVVTNEFIILSDDNRAPIDFAPMRIENRQRTVNGRMRSYHIADKLKISTSWDMLPSRSFLSSPDFDSSGIPTLSASDQYTSDGGAGGVELLSWYEEHPGSFWVYLAYDKYTNFGTGAAAFQNLPKYNQVVEMYFSSFNHSIVKRGGAGFDYWKVSVELEEV